MKPSPEQVREWVAQIKSESGEGYTQELCELAAAWGASQAQQTTEPLGFQIRRAIAAEDELRATKQTLEHAYAALQKVADKAQQTTEETDAEMALRSIASWLGVGGFNAPTVDAKAFERKIYEGVEMAIKSHYATAEEPEAWSIPEWSKQDDLGGRVPSDVRVALGEAHRAGVRVGMAQSQALQALQRGVEKVLADPEKHGLDLGEKQ